MLRTGEILLCCSLLILTVTSAQAVSTTSSSSELAFYPVPRVDIAPSVDGVLDDPAWESAPVAPIGWEIAPEHREWQDEQDFIGAFQAVWRDQTLYVGIHLRDDQIDTASLLDEAKDRIQVYIDVDNGDIKADEYRYVLPVQEDRTYEYYPTVFVMWGPVDDVCEFSFDLGHIPHSQQVIGFAIEYYDFDSQEETQVIGWPYTSELEANSSELGRLMFHADLRRDPQQMSVTWGGIKALF